MTVKSSRARPMTPDERRASIVDAVIPLILAHGAEVTTRQIADAAGIAEGTVYRAFADKTELIDAAIERVMDSTEVLDALAGIDRSLALEELLDQIVVILHARVSAVVAFMGALGPRDHARHKPDHGRGHAPLGEATDLVEALLEPHRGALRIPVSTAVDYIRVLIFGTAMPFLRSATPTDAHQLSDFILRGIAAEGE
ncbi:TetR/AcrR family transcriptional regulator [Demequina sp. NBRC 110056]|uniref:TetR/AcrR family transcriptional regulator n=1 Tax=Demequina sp. NBRC 110056 TaxID=1570345 RepID=UPI0009FF70A4|nr:TetR/AcrR family transcriptional regulator [Demequina sp. NBRC 110056]